MRLFAGREGEEDGVYRASFICNSHKTSTYSIYRVVQKPLESRCLTWCLLHQETSAPSCIERHTKTYKNVRDNHNEGHDDCGSILWCKFHHISVSQVSFLINTECIPSPLA